MYIIQDWTRILYHRGDLKMKYYYDELNKKAQLRARLDYFDKFKETEQMIGYLFRSMFTADGEIYE